MTQNDNNRAASKPLALAPAESDQLEALTPKETPEAFRAVVELVASFEGRNPTQAEYAEAVHLATAALGRSIRTLETAKVIYGDELAQALTIYRAAKQEKDNA